MPKYNETETQVIKRSQINFAGYNPKKHKPEHIEKVRANIERVAFFGGVVFNKGTGNLVDGHKRIMSLDILHGYTGKKSNDYDVKVEVCDLSLQAEKEQNVFFDKSRTAIDNVMLSSMLNDINPQNAGINDYGLPIENAGSLPIDAAWGVNADLGKEQDNSKVTAQPKETDIISAPKQKTIPAAYLSINFINQDQKNKFMDLLNLERFLCVMQGEELDLFINNNVTK